ncbi:uncharacterized protein KY384_001789 [Bacidia gigantensis]|uniref:uncharacterized protein n=1 Tax=Bacidia gigantensis TaxID=2732470 RepID=UPI001D053137|nr:uncharacterized protein KY384_001789 [Bacidia gigantensis]KAG8533007.1 hypothetical protein KY384_001789 [Bacidia gigantensis]
MPEEDEKPQGANTPASLCERCSRVPLTSEKLKDVGSEGSWFLGAYCLIKASNCPLCELVESICYAKSQMSWDPLRKPRDRDPIHLFWSEDTCGFYVDELSPVGSFICFAESEDSSLKRAKAVLPDWIDPSVCKEWLEICESTHGPECSLNDFDGKRSRMKNDGSYVLRLIDVEALCVINEPDACHYCALSYVWGYPGDGRLVLKRSNKAALMKPQSLYNLWNLIPKTISSAISWVRALGFRYLWVDSFCIVQDDEKELQNCIEVMDAYYSKAFLTIVAASGTDAYAGLPEMQEQLCSNRKLIFVDQQVYFRCQKMTCYENMHTIGLPGILDSHYSLIPFIFEKPVDFDNFTYLIMYYTRRNMTHQSDYLRACSGMLRKLSELMEVSIFEGLSVELERSLIFTRDETDSKPSLRKTGFPSFSWIGWQYAPDWFEAESTTDRRKCFDCDWIKWYSRSPDSRFWELDKQGIRALSGAPKFDDCRHMIDKKMTLHSSSTGTEPRYDELPPLGFHPLCFSTVSIFLKIAKSSPPRDEFHDTFGIHKSPCGKFMLEAQDVCVDDVQEFALVSRYETTWEDGAYPQGQVEKGYFALLLKTNGPLVERRGRLKIRKDDIAKSLPPGPTWRSIILG